MSEHALDRLFATIAARKGADAKSSYTAKLLAGGVQACAKKFGEEAVEAVIAATAQGAKELTAESADVLYHLLVLWAAAGITPDKNIICYCGTSREGSLLRFYLKHVAGYPNVRLYEGAWKEYVWLKDKSLPAETGGEAAGK